MNYKFKIGDEVILQSVFNPKYAKGVIINRRAKSINKFDKKCHYTIKSFDKCDIYYDYSEDDIIRIPDIKNNLKKVLNEI